MRIYAYEVRDDEKLYFENLAAELNLDIESKPDILSDEEICRMEEGSGLTVLGMRHYGSKVMEMLSQRGIQFLSTRTIGYNHIDIEAAKRYGIHVCNARYAPNGVADYTVMMILLCLRNYKMALWRMQVNDYSLGGMIGRELRNMTVGIIGTGRIGTQVIRELSGFGCRILCASRHENPEAA